MSSTADEAAPAPSGARAGRPKAPQWQDAEVIQVIPETPETVTLRLHLKEPAHFLPGQYYNVRRHFADRPRPVQRAYSVGSSPYPDPSIIDLTVKEMEGGLISPVLVRSIKVGEHIDVRGPYGTFVWTEDEGGPLYLIGAGSGVVPLMAIARYAKAKGLHIPMRLLFSSKSHDYVIYRDELDQLEVETDWFTVKHAFTRDPLDTRPHYNRRIDEAMVVECIPCAPEELIAYICGPPQMVEDAERWLIKAGAHPDRVRTEKYD